MGTCCSAEGNSQQRGHLHPTYAGNKEIRYGLQSLMSPTLCGERNPRKTQRSRKVISSEAKEDLENECNLMHSGDCRSTDVQGLILEHAMNFYCGSKSKDDGELREFDDDGNGEEEQERRESLDSSESEFGDDLSPSLWEMLPDDLLKRVLAKLPYSSLIQFRRVCKQWNNLILSPSSSCYLHRSDYASRSVLLNWDRGTLTVYSSSQNRWEKMPLLFLPLDGASLWLVASGGGLLCFERVDATKASFGEFIVCNPMTKTWRRLQIPCAEDQESRMPPPPAKSTWLSICQGREIVVGLSVIVAGSSSSSRKNGYKLVVAGIYKGCNRTTLVYNSLTGLWKKVARVPPGVEFYDQAITCSNGNMYCLGAAVDQNRASQLLKFNVEKEQWSQIELPSEYTFPSGLHYLQLVAHRGSILVLKGWSRILNILHPQTIEFLEIVDITDSADSLNEEEILVLEAKEMPPLLLNSLSGNPPPLHQSYNFRCAGRGEIMYVWQQEGSNDHPNRTLLVFDFSSNSCTWLSDSHMPMSFYNYRDWRVIVPSFAVHP